MWSECGPPGRYNTIIERLADTTGLHSDFVDGYTKIDKTPMRKGIFYELWRVQGKKEGKKEVYGAKMYHDKVKWRY
jgi:hypothetical protein